MNQEYDLMEINPMLEDKVYAIADEVIDILKELSRENNRQICGKTLGEKMFLKTSVKSLLETTNNYEAEYDVTAEQTRKISNIIRDKLTELVPSSMTNKISALKEQLRNITITEHSTDWIDMPLKVIKLYFNSILHRNKKLTKFMRQTRKSLVHTEKYISSEVTSQVNKIRDDGKFKDIISSNMDMIKDDFDSHEDFSNIKVSVIRKMENISRGIEKKVEQDLLRSRKTEKTLKKMDKRIAGIKSEADEIGRNSEDIEFGYIRDGLTGLYNREAYDEKIEETLAHLQRYNVQSSLIICDIDHFKKINDSFGHKVGDQALRKIAFMLEERFRKNDFLSRYGGEEFAIILPHTDLQGAIVAAEGIRSFIQSSIFSYKHHEIPLTISIGISAFNKEDNVDTVFVRADQALYLAKRSGRNKIQTENDVINKGVFLDYQELLTY